ncbi:glycine zipper 2TM domain-containing protein [Marinicella sp. S1101]|uniref:glycine zipper 2TM domain-containing protein n=1 Tax=Marinicella marina TaxID=2996016 RepID=UPI002260CD93|nr:glycine zipper 2TM domain-containing protein [Marinicella marina]MCX7554792.1 glycine zipper 2TM domain-containing protein [Marinicella marina]MDJ1140975.1 glycine zipper 2TM domain-containing protein [Marinicella marina]
MNKFFLTAVLVSLPLLASASRYNNINHSSVNYGRVIAAEPIYQNITVPEERQVCDRRRNYSDNHNRRNNQNTGKAILGGIIGGAIGNRFGKGRGRDASTALGVLIGAGIGANSNNRHHPTQNCYVETFYHNEERFMGYDVTYEFQGDLYQTQMQQHPGDRVRLRVNVDVID